MFLLHPRQVKPPPIVLAGGADLSPNGPCGGACRHNGARPVRVRTARARSLSWRRLPAPRPPRARTRCQRTARSAMLSSSVALGGRRCPLDLRTRAPALLARRRIDPPESVYHCASGPADRDGTARVDAQRIDRLLLRVRRVPPADVWSTAPPRLASVAAGASAAASHRRGEAERQPQAARARRRRGCRLDDLHAPADVPDPGAGDPAPSRPGVARATRLLNVSRRSEPNEERDDACSALPRAAPGPRGGGGRRRRGAERRRARCSGGSAARSRGRSRRSGARRAAS